MKAIAITQAAADGSNIPFLRDIEALLNKSNFC